MCKHLETRIQSTTICSQDHTHFLPGCPYDALSLLPKASPKSHPISASDTMARISGSIPDPASASPGDLWMKKTNYPSYPLQQRAVGQKRGTDRETGNTHHLRGRQPNLSVGDQEAVFLQQGRAGEWGRCSHSCISGWFRGKYLEQSFKKLF